MKEHSFFALLHRMRYIRRWGLMRNTEEENILEHSLETAFIAHNLALLHNEWLRNLPADCKTETSTEDNEIGEKIAATNLVPVDANRLAVLAMYHEVSEIFTGDMPTPIKYFDPQLRSLYGDIERRARNLLVGTLPVSLRDEYRQVIDEPVEESYRRLLKAADTLAAFMKCIIERRAGNDEFDDAYNSIYNKLMAMELPAVHRFMALYLPAMGCSLDELKND